jgi:hypothetical protein
MKEELKTVEYWNVLYNSERQRRLESSLKIWHE